MRMMGKRFNMASSGDGMLTLVSRHALTKFHDVTAGIYTWGKTAA